MSFPQAGIVFCVTLTEAERAWIEQMLIAYPPVSVSPFSSENLKKERRT